MGCSSSNLPVTDSASPTKHRKKEDDERKASVTIRNELFTQIINERSPHVRLDHCGEPKVMPTITGQSYKFDFKYCYISQRGYYPNSLGKANQDSYVICESIFGDQSTHLFGIFDGHGEYGDYCSHFAANDFPKNLVSLLKMNGGAAALDGDKVEQIHSDAMVKTNVNLHTSKIDDALSGTTGITVIIRGDQLLVANVGDSRAIIATEVDGKLRSAPLSNDQTPFRKDERERLKRCGAKIMTLEQIEGNEPLHENWGEETGDTIDEVGDPPRVWDSSLERPGCAFTRSIGDAVAESCGVFAVPEFLVWSLTKFDRYIIIASDGVFEFLTSQAVVDIISKFENCLEAAKYVVAESYRLWLTYDDRTDDISMIIIELSNVKARRPSSMAMSREPSVQFKAANSQTVTKPVRRVMSKQKRKVIAETWDREEVELFNFEANIVAKSPDELDRVAKMVQANFMFQHLSQQQRDLIFKVMKMRIVCAGEVIIKEGDPGDEMYIVDSGIFDVFKKDDSGVSQLVFTYNNVGSAFGELSLMYGKMRAATVKAKTDGALWTIGRQAFRAVLMRRKQEGLLKLLKSVPVIGLLSFPKLQRLCELATDEVYAGKEIVGDKTKVNQWLLCVVKTGSLKLLPSDKSRGALFRGEGTCLARLEIDDGTFTEVQAHGKTIIACLSLEAVQEVAGVDVEHQLSSALTEVRWRNQAANVKRDQSIFSNYEKLKLGRIAARVDLTLDTPILPIGEYAYLGNFYHRSGTLCSVKVVAKKRAYANKMDTKLLQERKFLAAMQGSNKCLANVVSTFQDERVALLLYQDVFTCDLAAALAADALTIEAKPLYAACIYSAVHALHNLGVLHRFLNPEAIYVTVKGVPKLADLRYAKRMDGSSSFTICGDPLFFAPEIIRQQGYDYAVDLWALGIVIYVMYEEEGPFGPDEQEETQLFTSITSLQAGALKFTNKTPDDAKALISGLLNPNPKARAGYTTSKEVMEQPYFSNIKWGADLGENGVQVGVQSSLEPSALFVEKDLEPFSTAAFDEF